MEKSEELYVERKEFGFDVLIINVVEKFYVNFVILVVYFDYFMKMFFNGMCELNFGVVIVYVNEEGIVLMMKIYYCFLENRICFGID